MKPNTILHADLLDIIFENRNKDYGAYALRKSYNKRLQLSLLCMFGFSIVICSLSFFKKPAVIYTPPATPPVTTIEGPMIETPKPREQHPTAAVPRTRPINTNEMPPRIVDSVNINKPLATPINLPSSLPIGDSSFLQGNVTGGGGNGNSQPTGNGTTKPGTKVDKTIPIFTPEVMPQYPGGVNALLDFLKKNLRAPEDIDEGDMISVKVRFVVNYDGRLEGFTVLQSGGTAFDNEVIRVLKKMPLWIPGKSNGEDVSVYYIVPVKFTSQY